MKCGSESSLSAVSWEIIEHRDGSDYYRFNFTLTSNGEAKNTKQLTVAFDGYTEATVVDAEHHIVLRQGLLSAEPEPEPDQ